MQRQSLTTSQRQIDKSPSYIWDIASQFYFWAWCYMEMLYWPLASSGQQSWLVCSFFGILLLAYPQPACYGGRVRKIKLWHSSSTAQPETKHCCVTNTLLVMNPKHSTIWAIMKKVNSIPVRPSIPLLYLLVGHVHKYFRWQPIHCTV